MFKVVSVVDKHGTAIDRLAQGLKPYLDNIEYKIVAVHPKRPDAEQLVEFEKEIMTADVIDYQYFRTAEMLRERYPQLKTVPSVLTHHNPYSIIESDWQGYDCVVGINQSIFKELKELTPSRVEYIGHASDVYFWKFNENYTAPRVIIMVANRIEAKKGILPVAKVCAELNYKMILVGNISDNDYFLEVMKTGAVEFAQNISDEQLREMYYKSGIHVCNSVDNFESGTLPILEAMQCGVPVLTRRIGHIPDIKSDDNLIIQHSHPENTQVISEKLVEMFASNLNKQREKAWMSIKHMNYERRAYSYMKLWREVFNDEKPVSVIIPIADKPEISGLCINAILNQDYGNIEIVIADDGLEKQGANIKEIANTSQVPIKYIQLNEPNKYNLAKARNLAVIQATGEILVFCDQRIIMEPNCISTFVENLKEHHWLYGNKGSKKDFVENLSCINRSDFITLGMFNERCDKYGSMSQECRSRARRQGYNTEYIDSAKAKPHGKSANRTRKKIDILESKNMLWKMGLN